MKKTIFVGLSGGVDSAVSATLLKKQGYEVVGVFIKTWHPDFLICNEEEERRDAMRVAAHLNIPFLTFDFENVYKKEVADYMISEYKKGRTPNPDVMCNKYIKFGAFLKRALSMGADFVATGHYAKNQANNIFLSLPAKIMSAFEKHYLLGPEVKNIFLNSDEAKQDIREKKYFLRKAEDVTKDQSYFLWTLRQEQLAKIIFPVGHLKKTEVRKLAKKFNLPVAEKKDSQGICFLGEVDLKEFLKHYIKEKRGRVVNQAGEIIGWHNGVVFNTLGERHGFTIIKKSPNGGPHYIVGKNVKKNILIVSQYPHPASPYIGGGAEGGRGKNLKNINWINEIPKPDKSYTAQIRYHGEFLPCKIKVEDPESSRRAQIFFKKPTLVASGQSCVIYDKDICLGGGVVK